MSRSPDRRDQAAIMGSRDQNPFRIDSYDLSGTHTYSQAAKVNNYMSNSNPHHQSGFKSEFKDAHYRQSLTG